MLELCGLAQCVVVGHRELSRTRCRAPRHATLPNMVANLPAALSVNSNFPGISMHRREFPQDQRSYNLRHFETPVTYV